MGERESAAERTADPLEAVRLRWQTAQEAESRPDRPRHLGALKAFLATVEQHSAEVARAGSEVAPWLDEASLAFSRASQPELARRAADLGLKFAPGHSGLLHHKALILLAQNRDLPEVVALVDKALEGSPHDKSLWATRGDALRLQGETADAVEAYLRAQQLDAASTQYVDRALKLAPHDPRVLRTKLELARAVGGDLPALAACEELLKENPGDLDLLRSRAELLASVGRTEDALGPLKTILAGRPDDARATLLYARLLFRLGRTDEGLPIVKAIVESSAPPDAPALAEVAALTESGAPELALAARERLRDVEPRNLQNLLELRSLAVRLEKPDVALGACRAVLAAYPDNLEAMRGIAEIELALGHADGAVEAYRTLRTAHPHAVAEIRKGLEVAQTLKRPEVVRDFADAILADEPGDPIARLALARTLSAEGDVAGAIGAYDALLSARPGEIEYLIEKKAVVSRTNDPAALAPVLDELFRLDPTRTDVAVERGNLWLALAYDQPEGSAERDRAARTALVSYERASSAAEAANVAELGIARASRLVGDPERAIEAYRRFLEDPGNARRFDIVKELAHTLRETGHYSEATEAYGRAISGGAEDPDLFWGAVEVLALLNQDARALQLLDLLLRREPSNPLFLRKKGQLLLKTGRRAEALSVLQQAVQTTHGDPHAHFEVAEALRAQGAYADAIAYYRQGLTIDPKNRHGRLALAETLQLAGQYSEVVQIIDPLLVEEPNDLAAWKVRGDALRSLGRPSEVLYSLKAILLLEPENGPALLEMYRLHRDAGETREAYDDLSRLLATDAPEASDATLQLDRGDLAATLGLAEEANQAYERAAQVDPVLKVEIAIRRARLRLTAGRPDLALEVLDDGLKAVPEGGPSNLAAQLLRAEILSGLERPSEARGVFEEVRRREPKSPIALAGIAKSMLEEGKHAEAAEFVRAALPQVPPQESLYLLLAEAESGLAHLDVAEETLRKGVELLPKSVPLWVRLGELAIARQAWSEASDAFAHALALAPADVEVLLRAGLVAMRLQHPNEALALYDRSTAADPNHKQAWTSRGLALVAIGRPTDAVASFDRALALDSDFAPAKDGKKVAVQKTRDTEIQRHGRESLLLEARLGRAVTKNDLFVTLHVPYEFLEPVLTAITHVDTVDLDRLDAAEVRELENASYHLITSALERRSPGIERRGLTLADVAVLAPSSYTLDRIQRLFGYLKAVLEANLKAENLGLTPDVEDLARQALGLPAEQRTLFQIVKNLKVGVYKARLIKVVESAGAAVHAPLPALDLGAYSPEFRAPEGPEGEPAGPEGAAAEAAGTGTASSSAAPPTEWARPPTVAPGAGPHAHGHAHGAGTAVARCVGCGGIASVLHTCSAALCQHCIGQFPHCPKCGQPVTTESTRPLEGVTVHAPSGRPVARPSGGPGGLRGVFQRSKPVIAPREGPGKIAPHVDHTGKPPSPDRAKAPPTTVPARREAPNAAPPPKEAKPAAKAIPEPPPPPVPAAVRPKREKRDDEPRL